MSKHQKHANIAKRKNGIQATNEVALLGVKCSVISDLVHAISKEISDFKLAYFDASHAKDVEKNTLSEFTFHHDGNLSLSTTFPVNKFAQRLQFSQYDAVFVNGNHYPAATQIVFLDAEKEASINKRIDQITDVQFFVKMSNEIQPFDSLKEKFPNWAEIPTYSIEDTNAIFSHVSEFLQSSIPTVKGLVLTGGKSTRMGADKATLEYYGKPQREHVKSLLEKEGLESFYSVRNSSNSLEEIHDTFLDLGPFGGICSAFQKDPNSAWFVLATDVPFVDEKLIQFVLENRNPSKVATAVKGKGKQFPEPLITIYEPKAYPMLLQYLAQGYSCPRKMLINSDIEVLEIDDALIRNINTPEEFEAAKLEINN